MWYKVLDIAEDGTVGGNPPWSLPIDKPANWRIVAEDHPISDDGYGIVLTQNPDHWLRLHCRIFEVEVDETKDMVGTNNRMLVRRARLTREVTAEWDFPNWWHVAHDLLLRDYFWAAHKQPCLWHWLVRATEAKSECTEATRRQFKAIGNHTIMSLLSELEEPLLEKFDLILAKRFQEVAAAKRAKLADGIIDTLSGYIAAEALFEADRDIWFIKPLEHAYNTGKFLINGSLIDTKGL